MGVPVTAGFRTALAAAAFAACLVPGLACATPDAKAQAEIDRLVAFVAASPCRFVRGGTEYDGKAARDHLAMKLGAVR